jgi:hypothetical protein
VTKHIFISTNEAIRQTMKRLTEKPIALDTKADKGDRFELVELAVAKIERN